MSSESAAAAEADSLLSKPMEIADSVFRLGQPDEVVPDKAAIKEQLMKDIKDRAMTPYYKQVCAQLKWEVDAGLVESMKAANAKELADLDAKIADAEANLGQNEVMDFVVEKAKALARMGETHEVVAAAYAAIPDKSSSKGQKIDVLLHLIRVALFHNDIPAVKTLIDDAKKAVEDGGDWDRRNRLKVYEATYFMCIRDFKKAAQLLLDSVATFTCLEMFSYKDLIFYTVIMGIFALDRVSLKKKVIDSPDVLSLILDIPHLSDYLNALHNCDYSGFFRALVALHPTILSDRYISRHTVYYVREMRVKAYGQFLDAYLSVTVASMASSFGVSEPFLDAELSQFIASSRLNAKIDKLDGVILTNRPDTRTSQYQSVLKHGDTLLNRIQRLARVVSV